MYKFPAQQLPTHTAQLLLPTPQPTKALSIYTDTEGTITKLPLYELVEYHRFWQNQMTVKTFCNIVITSC